MKSSITKDPVFLRSYSRKKEEDGSKERWEEIVERVIKGVSGFGGIREEELESMRLYMKEDKAYPSGRFMWVGGTEWSKEPKNYPGLYNCSSTEINSIEKFGVVAELCMTGCGIGFNLEEKNISKLPPVKRRVNVSVIGNPGDVDKINRTEHTHMYETGGETVLYIGDSREGWIKGYQTIIDLAFTEGNELNLGVYIGSVRPKGEKIYGFGGIANPSGLKRMYEMTGKHLQKSVGRQLTSVEICLIINEFGLVVEQGGVRRSAGIAQFSSTDINGLNAKANLWSQDEEGNWSIDTDKNALRMANHTRVYRKKPTYEEVLSSVKSQYKTGEGAIQWAGEAVARCNADILFNDELKKRFLNMYDMYAQDEPSRMLTMFQSLARESGVISEKEINDIDLMMYRLNLNSLNPCGEIPFSDNLCNLSDVHLNKLDPFDFEEQSTAFRNASLFAVPLLKHDFTEHHPTHQKGRERDPIVGVSISGVFDFFIRLFRTDYVLWWDAGRPDEWVVKNVNDINWINYVSSKLHFNKDNYEGKIGLFYKEIEKEYYLMWKKIVFETVGNYCERENIKKPNRCTTIQPTGTKSLLSGGAPGIHPTWGRYWIRRIKYISTDPIVDACLKAGYSKVKSQNDIANNTDLETIIEFPCKAMWMDYVDEKRLESTNLVWSAIAHADFYMNAQKNYITHNGSVTINFDKSEIGPLAEFIYNSIQNDDGYISAALLPKMDETEIFPNLPFERISKERYQQIISNISDINIESIINDNKTDYNLYQSACSSNKCQI